MHTYVNKEKWWNRSTVYKIKCYLFFPIYLYFIVYHVVIVIFSIASSVCSLWFLFFIFCTQLFSYSFFFTIQWSFYIYEIFHEYHSISHSFVLYYHLFHLSFFPLRHLLHVIQKMVPLNSN